MQTDRGFLEWVGIAIVSMAVTILLLTPWIIGVFTIIGWLVRGARG